MVWPPQIGNFFGRHRLPMATAAETWTSAYLLYQQAPARIDVLGSLLLTWLVNRAYTDVTVVQSISMRRANSPSRLENCRIERDVAAKKSLVLHEYLLFTSNINSGTLLAWRYLPALVLRRVAAQRDVAAHLTLRQRSSNYDASPTHQREPRALFPQKLYQNTQRAASDHQGCDTTWLPHATQSLQQGRRRRGRLYGNGNTTSRL